MRFSRRSWKAQASAAAESSNPLPEAEDMTWNLCHIFFHAENPGDLLRKKTGRYFCTFPRKKQERFSCFLFTVIFNRLFHTARSSGIFNALPHIPPQTKRNFVKLHLMLAPFKISKCFSFSFLLINKKKKQQCHFKKGEAPSRLKWELYNNIMSMLLPKRGENDDGISLLPPSFQGGWTMASRAGSNHP